MPEAGAPDAAEKAVPAADVFVDERQGGPTEAAPDRAERSQGGDQATPSFSACTTGTMVSPKTAARLYWT